MADQATQDMLDRAVGREEEKGESKGEGIMLRSRTVPALPPTQPDFLSPAPTMTAPVHATPTLTPIVAGTRISQ